MYANVYNTQGKKIKEIKLPVHFEEEIRPDLIKKAVLAIYSHKRQPYGSYKYAGLEAAAWTSKRRRSYRTSYGRGISRVPRAILVKNGGMFVWVARVVPNAVKGRKAHPPKPEKYWYEKINKKERRKAIRSAIAATANPYFVLARYERVSEILKPIIDRFGLPIVLESSIEKFSRTKQLKDILRNFGVYDFIKYVKETRRQRAGKGKRRGRRVKMNRGLLLIVGDANSPINKISLEEIEIVPVNKLNAEILAPGAKPGRFTIWTESAIKNLEDLFI
ncbi:MAG TPA: 50S ribosomal protein L4 [Candidatus Nanopusillus sp.]|nr:50S ribosomal protein L4 [Candidatus Nanopusillus sp.]